MSLYGEYDNFYQHHDPPPVLGGIEPADKSEADLIMGVLDMLEDDEGEGDEFIFP